MTAAGARPRHAYLDALRIAAAFLVIVNHTNSHVFQAEIPGAAAWWLSILWYYLSKLAVPLFVMISGACLLNREDSYRKAGWRFLRVLLALLLFSYLYFLYDAWVGYGLWPRAVDIGAFASLVWQMGILDDFWYLYLYLGLMLMLPLLQRLAAAMRGRDLGYLVGASFALSALWPLVTHYAPGLALPKYFDAPLFAVYIGLFFAGHWVHTRVTASRRTALASAAVLVATLALSAVLTYAESFTAERYWFMDERTAPMLPTVIGAVSAMALAKSLFAERQPRGKALAELGGCAFGVYLWQGFLIRESQHRLFEPLCAAMPPLCAVLVWELLIFALALALAWLMRRAPLVKRIL